MAQDFYEFHVAGLIGPVIRSALPELSISAEPLGTFLTGRVHELVEVDDLLRRLHDQGLITTHIVISEQDYWRTPTCAVEHPSPVGMDKEPWVEPP